MKVHAWNAAQTLLHIPPSDFVNAPEEEKREAVEGIDTNKLHDAMVKIVKYNGEIQVRLQTLTASEAEVNEAEEKLEPQGTQDKTRNKRPKKEH